MNIQILDGTTLTEVNATVEFYERLRALLKIKRVFGKNFVRVGRHHDGGYDLIFRWATGTGDLTT